MFSTVGFFALFLLGFSCRVSPDNKFEGIGSKGENITVFLKGDEWNHRFETSDGFTIVNSVDNNRFYFLQNDGFTISDSPPDKKHVLSVATNNKLQFNRRLRQQEKIRTKKIIDENMGVWSSSTWKSGIHTVLVVKISFIDANCEIPDTNWTSLMFLSNDSLKAFYLLNSYNKLQFVPAQENCGLINDGIASVTLSRIAPGDNDEGDERIAAISAVQSLSTCINWASFDKNGNGHLETDELHVIFIFLDLKEHHHALQEHVNVAVLGHMLGKMLFISIII
jgi:hypothetical protein